jgi:cytosine deaminase
MNSAALTVRRARVPVALLPPGFAADPCDPAALCDLTISAGKISSVSAASPLPPAAGDFDAAGRLVFPAFVEAHTHLDKAHTWCRAPNRTSTFMDALTTLARDKPHQTPADLRLRADFALRSAWAHGTRVLRTHVDSDLATAEPRHAVMAELRSAWAGRIALQTVALCNGADYATPAGEKISDLALRHGASALGGFLQMSAALPHQLDRLLAIAHERRLGLDLHVDENGDATSECLRVVAEAVLRHEFSFSVVCGHCCSLSMQSPARQRETIALARTARIGVIALPLCNLYLQDRRAASASERAPQWRGVAPVLDLLAAGVPVACASDNLRDAFYPFGDLDALEVYTQSVRLAHLDADLAGSVRVVTSTAAELVGRPEFGRIAPGAPAHLVVFEARSFSELLSRPAAARLCIDGCNVHSPAAPDFEELRAAGLMTFAPSP